MTTTIAGDQRQDPAEISAADHLQFTDRLLLAQRQAENHIEIEITEDIENILGTLTDEGPYAYTLNPTFEEGRVRQHLIHTRDEIRDCYETLHNDMGLRGWQSTTQVLASWYTFHAGWANVEVKADGSKQDYEALVLFPTMGNRGITGEIFWARITPGPSPEPGQSLSQLRAGLRAEHDAYLDAVRRSDIEGMLAALSPDVQVGMRDYTLGAIDPAKSLVELDGKDAVRAHLQRMFETFVPESVDIVQRNVDDWYIFSELRWVVRSRKDDQRITFLTADYAELGPDSKIIARLGHGTAPVSI